MMFEFTDADVVKGSEKYGTYMTGGTFYLRQNYDISDKIDLFTQEGVGFVFGDAYKNRSQDKLGNPLEFTFQLGAGARYNLSNRWSIDIGFLLKHISNRWLSWMIAKLEILRSLKKTNEVIFLQDVEKRMLELKNKEDPTQMDMYKYIRYLINVKEMTDEEVIEETSHWPLEKITIAINKVQRENAKPKPKRYYVSLKEPLDDTTLK